jgi:hypothetical protein
VKLGCLGTRAFAVLFSCAATAAHGEIDEGCRFRCLAQGYVPDFCTRACIYDQERGTAFGGAGGAERLPPAPVATPSEPTTPPVRKPQPPTASLEALNPAQETLRDELRKLRAENSSLKKELAATRRALEELQGRGR